MRHIREGDSAARTTIMVHLENEVGIIGDSRDRSALAKASLAAGERSRASACRLFWLRVESASMVLPPRIWARAVDALIDDAEIVPPFLGLDPVPRDAGQDGAHVDLVGQ